MRTPVTVGLAGLDEWGARAARVLSELPRAELRWLCDAQTGVPARRLRLPAAQLTDRFADLLEDEAVDAIVVSAPVHARAMLTRRALEAGKHVLTRSPLSTCGPEADELAALAQRRDVRLLAGHDQTFEPAVQQLKRILAAGGLGDVYYLYGSRHRWSGEQTDALWDVLADEIPLVLDLVADEPYEVQAFGESYLRETSRDVVIAQLRFATGIAAHLHVSTLGPSSAGRLTVVGSDRLAVLAEGRLAVHERIERGDGSVAVRVEAHDDPRSEADDPLHQELDYFLTAIRTPLERVSGRPGAAVAHVLEALSRSLAKGAAEPVGQQPRAAPVLALHAHRRRAGP